MSEPIKAAPSDLDLAQEELQKALSAWCARKDAGYQLGRLAWQTGCLRSEVDTLITVLGESGVISHHRYFEILAARLRAQAIGIYKALGMKMLDDGSVLEVPIASA